MNSDKESLSPLLGADDFERSLLGAGRTDSECPDVEQEWSRFAGRMALVVGGLEPISGVHQVTDPLSSGAAPTSVIPPSVAPTPSVASAGGAASGLGGAIVAALGRNAATSPLAAKLVAVALLGGGLVAGGFWMHSRAEAARIGNSVSSTHPASAFLGASEGGREPASSRPVEGAPPRAQEAANTAEVTFAESEEGTLTPPSADESSSQAAKVKSSTKRRAATMGSKVERPEPGFGGVLTGQIMLLDEARLAPASRAVHLVDEFHRRYPGGALRADAELVALQALRTMGHTTDLKLRGMDFLRRYPRDPHSAKVRTWLGEVGRR